MMWHLCYTCSLLLVFFEPRQSSCYFLVGFVADSSFRTYAEQKSQADMNWWLLNLFGPMTIVCLIFTAVFQNLEINPWPFFSTSERTAFGNLWSSLSVGGLCMSTHFNSNSNLDKGRASMIFSLADLIKGIYFNKLQLRFFYNPQIASSRHRV
jgi:hypothetical protein